MHALRILKQKQGSHKHYNKNNQSICINLRLIPPSVKTVRHTAPAENHDGSKWIQIYALRKPAGPLPGHISRPHPPKLSRPIPYLDAVDHVLLFFPLHQAVQQQHLVLRPGVDRRPANATPLPPPRPRKIARLNCVRGTYGAIKIWRLNIYSGVYRSIYFLTFH